MKFLVAAAVAATIGVSAGAASAATFVVGDGTDFALTANFDPGAGAGIIGAGDIVQAFDGSAAGPFADFSLANALQLLDAPTDLEFTLLSSEAGYFNITTSNGVTILDGTQANGASTIVGSQALDGPLQFSFGTNGGAGLVDLFADNGAGTIDGRLAIAFYMIDARTIIALFDDSGAGPDSDFDDLVVRISAVPIPAPAGFLIAAVAGFGFLSRRRSALA